MADKSLLDIAADDKAGTVSVVEPREQVPAATSQYLNQESRTLMEVIAAAARDPNTDVSKLERLMAMHERILARDAEQAFNEAMTAAQTGMRPVAADASNPQTKSKYASYQALDHAVRPIYTKHGFGLSFNTGDDAPADHVRVLCYVSHSGGHTRTYKVDMPADGKGAKGGDVMTKTHATGSAMSYGSRYLLKGIFNIAVGESDDDGNAAGSVGNEYISPDKVQTIKDLIDRTNANFEAFCEYFKIEAIRDLRNKDFARAVAALNLKDKKIKEKAQ